MPSQHSNATCLFVEIGQNTASYGKQEFASEMIERGLGYENSALQCAFMLGFGPRQAENGSPLSFFLSLSVRSLCGKSLTSTCLERKITR